MTFPPPRCKICGQLHYGHEGHIWPRDETRVTKTRGDENASVAPAVTATAPPAVPSKPKPNPTRNRGGRPKSEHPMSGPERQRAYRERKKSISTEQDYGRYTCAIGQGSDGSAPAD